MQQHLRTYTATVSNKYCELWCIHLYVWNLECTTTAFEVRKSRNKYRELLYTFIVFHNPIMTFRQQIRKRCSHKFLRARSELASSPA